MPYDKSLSVQGCGWFNRAVVAQLAARSRGRGDILAAKVAALGRNGLWNVSRAGGLAVGLLVRDDGQAGGGGGAASPTPKL
jgi:hypothetical protein